MVPKIPKIGSAKPTKENRLKFFHKLSYGFGAVAYGVKDNGFAVFVLIFYSQIVGLPVATVGMAIMVALFVDSFIDPIIGQISDNWKSKWGRRHPFMYASVLPVTVSYLLLWNPPTGWSEPAMVAYLIAIAILIRTCISMFEIPSTALAAELTTDYDERTQLLSYRYFFGWLGGVFVSLIGLTFFFQPDHSHPKGNFDATGFSHYGLIGAGLIAASILLSALGTHSLIKFFPTAPKRKVSLAVLFQEMITTFSHSEFLHILATNILLATILGIISSLSLYFNLFFWGLATTQMAKLMYAYIVGAGLAFYLAPFCSRLFGKKVTAALMIPLGSIAAFLPIILRLLGLFPTNGSDLILPLIFADTAVTIGFLVGANILVSSMIADVVEDSELRTGRRSEGLFFAAAAFVNKTITGIGVLVSSLILSAIAFPQNAEPGKISVQVIRNLGLVYIPILLLLTFLAVIFMRGYRITRSKHEQSLLKLAAVAELITEGVLPGSTIDHEIYKDDLLDVKPHRLS